MNNDRSRFWVAVGAFYGLVAVGASALAAHLRLDAAATRVLASAAQMNGWHALALLFCGVWRPGWFTHAAGACFTLGVLLFSGSLYAQVFGHPIQIMGQALAPFGGGVLMVGWGLLALSALGRER